MHINENLEVINTNQTFIQPITTTIIVTTYEEVVGEDGETVTEIIETERVESSTITHPASIFTRWSREEKAAIGIYEVEQEPISEGMQATDWTYEIVGDYAIGAPTLVPIPEPIPYVPQTVSRAQAMYVMTTQGIWDQAVAFVEAIEDPMEKSLAKIALYETQEYSRDSPFLALASDSLGLTEEDLDNLFIAAEQVKL